MTRLLVTGGAGFIGSAIVRRALADGHEVRVLDSSATTSTAIPARSCAPTSSRASSSCTATSATGSRSTPRSTASTSSATRPPRSASASTSRTPPTTSRRTTPARPTSSPAWTGTTSGDSSSRARWSSTVRARTRRPTASPSGRRPAAARTSTPVASTRSARTATPAARPHRRVRRARPPQRVRADEGRAGAPGLELGTRDGRPGGRVAVPQRLRTRHAREHPLRRCRVTVPLGAGPR